MEELAHERSLVLSEMSLEEMDQLWDEVKKSSNINYISIFVEYLFTKYRNTNYEKSYNLFIAVSSIVYGQKEKKLDSLFTSLYTAKEFNGNVLVAEKGKSSMKKALGWLMKTKQKLDKNTVFELASVSKQFTAMGIVQLEKEGKLSYNDPLTRYFPELGFINLLP